MGAFNTISLEASCPFCGSQQQWTIQFKYGNCRQFKYGIGDKLRWGGNRKGSNVGGEVRTGGFAEERCKRCARGSIAAAVYLTDNIIERVDLLKEQLQIPGYFEKIDRSEVHIVLGDTAAGVLIQAIGCGRDSILIQHDPLSVGPLPRHDSLEDFRALRENFWRRIDDGTPSVNGANDLLSNADVLRHREAVTVWVGAGAADQFLVPWVVHLLKMIDAPIPKLSVVQFERLLPKHFYVAGLGVLSPDQVKSQGQRRQLFEDEVAEIEGIWSALTAPLPDDLLSSIERDPTSVPLLRRALRTMVDRYPDLDSGLSHWDQELLNSVRSHGPSAVMTIGNVLAASYDTDYPDTVGDVYLFGRLRQLADPDLVQPPVVIEGDQSSCRGCEVRLTDAGEAFLEGKMNFVKTNGIDDWVAGVHLDSRRNQVWFRNGGTLMKASL
jgi:hypothetical protein